MDVPNLFIDPALVNQFGIAQRLLEAILLDAKDAIFKYSMGDWNIFRDRIH
jgi:hypothetical protein